MTIHNAKDLAIRLTDCLVEAGIIRDCLDTDDQAEFEVQDVLFDQLVVYFNLDEQNGW